MLDDRGLFLVVLVAALAAAGLIFAVPALVLVAVVLGGGLTLEIRRLRAGLVDDRGAATAARAATRGVASSRVGGLHGSGRAADAETAEAAHSSTRRRPWGIVAHVAPPRVVASTRQRRSHQVGQQVALRLIVRGSPRFAGLWLEIERFVTTGGLEIEARTSALRLRGQREVELIARADTAAVHRVHGLRLSAVDALGLVRAQLFVPCPYEVAVLPRSLPLDLNGLPETRRNARRAVGGGRPDRVAGQGDELRELREHMPGDPFKHIAWKASARKGRLMSRVFEHERARSVFTVLDTGSTMRHGRAGRTALDAGVDLAHSLAEGSARQNLPFGMSLVDGEVVARHPVREGLAAVQACDRALLNVRRAVAAHLAPVADEQLLRVVASYLRAVEGVPLPEATTAADRVRLRQRTVMAALARLPERERAPALRGPEPSPRADLAILRRYCRAADLALPYRAALSAEERVQGLVAGIGVALAARKGPFVIVLISDFLGLRGATEPLWQAVGRARARGHRTLVISLTEPRLDVLDVVDGVADVDTARGLMTADLAGRSELLDELRQGARRAGASFLADPQPKQLARTWGRVAFG